MSSFARCVLTTTPDGRPLVGIDIEMVRTDTMAIVQVVQTTKTGTAQFTTAPPAPFFFRPRIIRKDWSLQVTSFGGGRSLYDRVVDPAGQGTDLTIADAVASLPAAGGTIGVVTGTYQGTAALTIPAGASVVIEGIGHGIIEDISSTPDMAVKIKNDNILGYTGVVIAVGIGAQLTLRGVEVIQERNADAITGATVSTIVLEDSYVHVDAGSNQAIDSSYMIRIHRSIVSSTGDVFDPVGAYVECSESRLVATGSTWNGAFGTCIFEKCIMTDFRCTSGTISSDLRIEDCTVREGITVTGQAHTDIQIIGCDVDGGAADAIIVGNTTTANYKRLIIANNTLHTTGGHGIHITGYVLGGAISGNTCNGNAAGYTVTTDNAAYLSNTVFGANTHDGTMLGTYGPLITASAITVPHNLLDGVVHSDTLLGVVLDGDMIIGNVTPKWSRVAITIPGAAALMNVWGIVTGELRGSWKALFDATNPADIGAAASPGTATIAAHRDHIHTDTLRHAAVTLSVEADTLLGLTTQQITLDTQAANTVFAGRADAGVAVAPTFRSLVALDIPDISGTYMTPGAHTAIGDSAPHHAAVTLAASAAVLMDLTGQAISLDTQAANTFFAGRADVGAAQAPTFRAIVALDLAAGAPSGKFLKDDMTWATPAGGAGGHVIQEEGTPLTARANLNFVGAGITATDGGAGPDSTIVTLAGVLLAAGTVALTGNWNPGAFIVGNYDFTAKPAALYVGDANCSLTLEAGGPALVMDSGLDFMGYVRASNYFNFSTGGVEGLQISSTFLRAVGYARVGSLAAPTNTTAGDLTVGRVLIGADGAFVAGTPLLQVGGAVAITGHIALGNSSTIQTPWVVNLTEIITSGTTTSRYGLYLDLAYAGASYPSMYGEYVFVRDQHTSVNTTPLIGGLGFVVSYESANNITDVYGVYGRLTSEATGAGTWTRGTCFYAWGGYSGSVPATVYGMRVIANLAPADVTTGYGVRVEALAAATSTGLYIAALAGATANYGVDIAALAGAGINIGIRNATPNAIQLTGTDCYIDQKNVATIANITTPAAGYLRQYGRLNADLAGATNFKTAWAKDENGFESSMSLRARSMWPKPLTMPTAVAGVAMVSGTAHLGFVEVPFPIKVNKILYNVSAAGGNAANIIRIAIYSEDGQQKYIDATDAVGTNTGVRTIDITDTTLAPGVYLVLIKYSVYSTTVNTVSRYTYDTTMTAHIASEPDWSGTLTSANGAAPATIDPTALTTVAGALIPVLRFLGTALGTD